MFAKILGMDKPPNPSSINDDGRAMSKLNAHESGREAVSSSSQYQQSPSRPLVTRQAGSKSVSPNPSRGNVAPIRSTPPRSPGRSQVDSKTQNPNADHTEQTPLLYDDREGGCGNSQSSSIGAEGDSSIAASSSSYVYPNLEGTSSGGTSSWKNVKDHLHKGDFIMYKLANIGSNVGSSDGDDDDNSGFQQLKNRSRPAHSTRAQQIVDEIRSGISFTPSQCIMAILLYLTFACVCYDFIFEPEWGIIDTAYFAVTTFSKLKKSRPLLPIPCRH